MYDLIQQVIDLDLGGIAQNVGDVFLSHLEIDNRRYLRASIFREISTLKSELSNKEV